MSKIKVEFLSMLSNITNEDELEIPIETNISVKELISILSKKYGDDFKDKILDDNGNLVRFILVSINGNQKVSSNESDFLIHSGDKVSFIPAIAGG